MKIFEELITNFPIRNSREEKNNFINWLKNKYPNLYIDIAGHNKNIVFGNLDKAKIIITAHYDTPKGSFIPNMMFPANSLYRNLFSFVPFIILSIMSLIIAYLITIKLELNRLLLLIIYFALYFILIKVLFKLFKNKNNYNDNTSGIAVVLNLLDKNIDDVAYVLFDNEEKGLKGSKAFSKKYKFNNEKLFINLDCVGNGNYFCFIKSKQFVNNINLDNKLTKYNNIYIFDNSQAILNSDNKSFNNSIGICACKQNKSGLLYCNRIHTKRDVIVSNDNLEMITNIIIELLS